MSEDCRMAMSIAEDSNTHRVQRLSSQTSPTTAQAVKERPARKSLSMSSTVFICVRETYLAIRARLARLARKAGRIECFIQNPELRTQNFFDGPDDPPAS